MASGKKGKPGSAKARKSTRKRMKAIGKGRRKLGYSWAGFKGR